jgi:hypothetical protein
MKTRQESTVLSFLACTAALLSACGGGGGTSANPPVGTNPPVQPPQPPPPPPPPPSPAATVPFSVGKRWVYDLEWRNTFGGAGLDFLGERLMYTVAQVNFQGRSAWQVILLDVNELAVNAQPLSTTTRFLSQSADGLDIWVGTPTSGNWRRALAPQAQPFSNSAFFMAGGPNHGNASTTMTSSVTVTVPSGTYSTMRATYQYRDNDGGAGANDVDENREEYFADGVGLVASLWDYHFDDNDPSASDSSSVGSARLRAIDNGPDIVMEFEPNDDLGATAQPLLNDSFVAGGTRLGDVGRVVIDANVDANSAGEKRLQDWYRFTVTTTGNHSVLLWHHSTPVNGVTPDLDLYLFREGTGGALTFIAKSNFDPTRETGEWLTRSLQPGTYYAAVQAWHTGADPIGYWLNVR